MKKLRLAAFASGRGSNLAALISRIHRPALYGEIALVVSDKSEAKALEHAKIEGIPTLTVSYKEGRAAAESVMTERINALDIDLIALCGFMRLLSPSFVQSFNNRIVNIHPSLLPAFPGLHAQKQALDYGVKLAGCTVHYVDEGMDTGKIIAQTAVPVLEGDTEESLSARILEKEHETYASAIQSIAQQWEE